jgi:hypothetical protein
VWLRGLDLNQRPLGYENRKLLILKLMFTIKSAQGYWDNGFKLSNFAALGEFSLRDYRGREMGKRFGEAYIEGVEQGLGRGAWRGDAETGSLSFYLHFHCAQHLELSEPFFDGEIEFRPGLSESSADPVCQHHDQYMGTCMLGGAHVDGACFKMCGFASSKSHFDLGEVFVSVMHGLRGGGAGRKIGFQYVAAVQLRRFLQRLWICL